MSHPSSPSGPSASDAGKPHHDFNDAHSAFRKVPRTGVIYVMGEAARLGYQGTADPLEETWCNLGQGMPEVGPLANAPPRQGELAVLPFDQEYAPVAGVWELREAVADFYNRA